MRGTLNLTVYRHVPSCKFVSPISKDLTSELQNLYQVSADLPGGRLRRYATMLLCLHRQSPPSHYTLIRHILLIFNATTQPILVPLSSGPLHSTPCSILLLQLPPCRQNHLFPPPLQQRLPLTLILRPRLSDSSFWCRVRTSCGGGGGEGSLC